MSLRAINQIVVHLESFRNIQLWYQGMYFLTVQIVYKPILNKTKTIHAHPFAHTENFHPNEQAKKFYDHQIIKTSYIDDSKSQFVTKSFVVKYYEEEVQLNDICHFRIETSLSDPNPEIILTTNLMFVDLSNRKQIDKMDAQQKQMLQKQAKLVKSKKFHVKNLLRGIHQFVPVVFDQNYFCLVNMSLHSICLDYRLRINTLQLSEFSKLSYNEKMRMIQANNKIAAENRQTPISFYKSILKDLSISDQPSSLKTIEHILISEMKNNYTSLLYNYSTLFSKIVTDKERKLYGNRLINPNVLCLFQDSNQILRDNSAQNIEMLFKKYRTKNSEQIVQKILDQTNMISSQLVKLWHCYIDLFRISPRFSVSFLESQFKVKKRDFWTKLVHVNKVIKKNLFESSTIDTKTIEKNLLQQKIKTKLDLDVQQQIFVQRRTKLPTLLYNIHYLEDEVGSKIKESHKMPHKMMQQEESEKETKRNKDEDGIHLVVFVHGFQGNSFDMRLIKNYVSFMYPQSMFLCATSNEEQTDTDILEMGERLSNQVKNFIFQNFPMNTLSKISFIGHSLGGVKIRAALPHLLQHKDKFFCFMSFSSPHLGYGINTSSVVQAGIWVLQKMKNSICLKQLSMSDSMNLQQTCLYKLSQAQGLEHFKHIFLFSSRQDSYAPFESARIQIHPQFSNDPSKQIHCKMVKNLLSNVKSGCLRRINVLFEIGEKNLDSLIGRTAHIMFLESQQLMKAILYTEPDLLA